jgi:Ca2+-binding RTX toxin-like protein
VKKNSPRLAIITAVISLFTALCPQAAPGASDPNLSITIRRTSQNIVLQWFGSNAVPYQVESTSNLMTWANSSLVVTGAGGILSYTNSIAGQARAFYRLRRLPIAAAPSAVFNSGTGVLTIIGDDFDNSIVVGRNAGGTILVNNGAVPVTGGIATVTNTVLIEVFGRAGHDELTIDQTGGAMPPAHLFGEPGNDTLTGASAIDDLVGGPGSDTVVGRGGNDRLFGDADNDTFVWNPGDGSDVVEGGIGQDTLTFNGSAGAEIIQASANGGRLLFTRNVGAIVMDVDDVERVTYNALAGADSTIVNNLTGMDVTEVNVNLAGTAGGATGDAVADVIILNGTSAANVFNIAANAGAVEAAGLGALVRVVNGEGSNDVVSIVGVGGDIVNINGSALADIMTVTAVGSNAQATATGFTIPVQVRGALTLQMNGLGGADTISCAGNLAAIVPIVLDGGNDNDTLLGSNGIDVILGGAGNDQVDGNQGNDVAFLGGDNDTFQWDPGDGSDTVEGQAGSDLLLFNGSAGAEIIQASANGGRLLFTRNVGNIIMDVDDVERVTYNALAGADSTIVNNLTGTDVTEVNVNLAGTAGGTTGDAVADVITINGTPAADTFNMTASAGVISVSGLIPLVRISNSEVALDDLIINGLGGIDVFNIGAGVTTLIGVTTNQ